MLDWAGESQYYVEPKRLARLGYLDARKEPGKTGERTVYTLTDQGLDALAEWARTPVHFTALKSEALLRLLVAGFMRRLFELHLNLVDEVSASSTGPGSSSVRIGGHGAASCR
jgi:DNA-binding PadR family transcriptional regulator